MRHYSRRDGLTAVVTTGMDCITRINWIRDGELQCTTQHLNQTQAQQALKANRMKETAHESI